MIVFPKVWKKHYEEISDKPVITNINIPEIVESLTQIISGLSINHLAYSGGIDSTIMLCLMSKLNSDVFTYTIAVRNDHPDIKFAQQGSSIYKSHHHEFIMPLISGDDAVKQLFIKASSFTNTMICCDGIDEFMCGYYKHMEQNKLETYKWFLSRLLPDHLEPLNENSNPVKVYLPYLDEKIISIFNRIPLNKKVDSKDRKKIVFEIAKYLGLPEDIIYRNKYGFCDAVLKIDK